jgi:glycosyltransferase involved in cell wall biosynthesis
MLDSCISVVTPTLARPSEVQTLLKNLSQQTSLPLELLLVDGAPSGENDTQQVVEQCAPGMPFLVRYIRYGGGTAIQRNVGIDVARGDFIAFVDDDIRLEPDFFERILGAFAQDEKQQIGGITGYITNQHLDPATSRRWQWYRRLKLFTTYEPGRFDYQTGFPINRYLQPPHDGLREVDFMSSNSAVWRSKVFEHGLRFDEFFVGYGVMEDAQMSLRAKRSWVLMENGSAHCLHLHVTSGREDSRSVSRKTSVNHRYLFITIVPQRTWFQEYRFWRVQFIQMLIFMAAVFRHPNRQNWLSLLGKVEGLIQSIFLKVEPNRKVGT